MSPPAPDLRVIPGGAATEPSEQALLRALLAGDASAFAELVRRHRETVYRLLRRYASTEDARDLTQKALLQAFEAVQRTGAKLERSDEAVPFKAWLVRIAVNLGKNHVRDTGRWPWVTVEVVDRERHDDARADDTLLRRQQEALTRRAVTTLPPRQREVFTLRIDGGLPFADIAEALEISEGNAKAHFHHAVKRLKEEVAKQGGLE